jgi:glycosyltransferase involved in cell wall biosynthesis
MRETAGMRSATQKKVQQAAYSLAHQIVANSEAVRSKLINDGTPADKITVVYNGLDTARLIPHVTSRTEALSLFGIHEDRRFITIVANMRLEVKDYPMFLRSARQVLDAEPAAAFLLAGEGELTDSLRALAVELGIQDSTHFLGRCDHVADLLSISEICVLSSKAEGFSNSILEYMAAGRPVVVTNVGGAAELVSEGETGYLVSSGDDSGMAARIISLLRNPDKARELGENGKRVVEEKFSCAAQLSRTESLYEQLLQKT